MVRQAVRCTSRYRFDRGFLGSEHDVIDVARFGREGAADRPRSRHVGAVTAADLGAGVEQYEIGRHHQVVMVRVVQHFAAHAQDRVVGRAAAVARKRAFDLTGEFLLVEPWAGVGHGEHVGFVRDLRRLAHVDEFFGRALHPQAGDLRQQRGVADGGWRPEVERFAGDRGGFGGRQGIGNGEALHLPPARLLLDQLAQFAAVLHLSHAEGFLDVSEARHRAVPQGVLLRAFVEE